MYGRTAKREVPDQMERILLPRREYPHLIAGTLAACTLQCFNRHTLLQCRALAVNGQIMATFMQGPQR